MVAMGDERAPSSGWERLTHRLVSVPPTVGDGLLAVVLAALTWGTILLDEDCGCPLPVWAAPVILGQTLPLALRRRATVPVWAVVGLVTALHGASELGDPPVFFGALVALYTVASRCSRRTSHVVAAVSAVALVASMFVSRDTPLIAAAFQFMVFGTAWILGDNVRVRRAYTAEVERRAARLELEREQDVRRAAAEERARIARELHDVVAHHVSVIALQSQAADALLPGEPGRAGEVVAAIAETARDASAELRRLLGVLRREGDGPSSLAPQPGIDDVKTLVRSVGDTGLTVRLSIEGQPRPLPSGIGLTAYRIVQEALTNVLKHAQAHRADVVIGYGEVDLSIRIADDGTANGAASNGQGQGIVGLRERVALFGGALDAGPRSEGGFEVHARLPLSGR